MKSGITVVNLREEPYDIYIGRPSKWGNPFEIGKDGNRSEVIKKYRDYIKGRPELMVALRELRGKRLGCFCKPQMCHGDVLVELLEAQMEQEGKKFEVVFVSPKPEGTKDVRIGTLPLEELECENGMAISKEDSEKVRALGVGECTIVSSHTGGQHRVTRVS